MSQSQSNHTAGGTFEEDEPATLVDDMFSTLIERLPYLLNGTKKNKRAHEAVIQAAADLVMAKALYDSPSGEDSDSAKEAA